MKRTINKIICFALSLCMFVGLTACSSAPVATSQEQEQVESVTLSVINYHVGNDYAAAFYQKMFEEFPKTELGKGVTFKFEEIPTGDAAAQKIKLLIANGELPDIVLSTGISLTELAVKANKVADLTPYFEADPEWKNQFDPKSLEFNSVDGKIYGVPNTKTISYIYYNKKLFKKAGIKAPDVAYASWDEFLKACDQLKATGITPLAMDSADFGWLTNLWACSLIGTANEVGNKWMNTLQPKDYNTPELEDAFAKIQTMFQKYATNDAPGGKYDPMAARFFNGEIAMIPNGPWMVPDFKNTEKAPENFYDDVGVMLFPQNGMIMEAYPGDMVGAKDPKKIEAAVNFLKFVTCPENQFLALKMTGLQPESPHIVIPEEYKEEDPLMADILDISAKAKMTYGENQVMWFQNTLDTFSTQLPELAYGKITPKEFCTRMTESANKN